LNPTEPQHAEPKLFVAALQHTWFALKPTVPQHTRLAPETKTPLQQVEVVLLKPLFPQHGVLAPGTSTALLQQVWVAVLNGLLPQHAFPAPATTALLQHDCDAGLKPVELVPAALLQHSTFTVRSVQHFLVAALYPDLPQHARFAPVER